jgi:hypothetical protein
MSKMFAIKGKVTSKKTWYNVMVGGKTIALSPVARAAFGTKSDALDMARQYRIEHPDQLVGVYQVSKVKVFGLRRRGRIIRG